jgi:lysyl-tRNA synthetase class 2
VNYRQSRIRRNLELRAGVVRAIRSFFTANGYLEVETPNRIPAPAPEAHIDAQAAGSWYMHTSPELCMKRLLAAGYPKIFQICKCYRRDERGSRHLPELTMLEWYAAGTGYRDMMTECERLIRFIARNVGEAEHIGYRSAEIDLSSPWRRVTVAEAFERYASLPLASALEQNRFDEVLSLEIEERLGQTRPTFLYDYPAAAGALARRKAEDHGLVERFELYIGGLELCNAFGELTDPAEQKLRFEWEQNLRRYAGKPIYPMPSRFLQAMKDMPAASGNALGVDRLVMLFADADSIDEGVACVPDEL